MSLIANKNKTKKANALHIPEILTDGYICVLVSIYPLWVGTSGYMGITDAKYDFFVGLSLVYMAAMFIALIELFAVGYAREVVARMRRPSITQICFLGYAVCCILSALLSDYGSKVWVGAGRYEGLQTILIYISLFFFISHFGKFKKWYLYLIGMVVMINAVIGFLQFAGYNPFSLFPEEYTYHDAFVLYANAFMGTLGNIDVLSALLSLVVPLFFVYFIIYDKSTILLIPFCLGVFQLLLTGVSAGLVGIGVGVLIVLPYILNTKRRFSKALVGVCLLFICAAIYKCLYLSYENRITAISFRINHLTLLYIFIAILLCLFSYMIYRSEIKSQWNSNKARKVLILIAAFAVITGTVILWAYPFSEGIMAEAHQLLHGNIDPKLGSSRIRIWQEVLRLIPEHLWFGGGPDTLAERVSFSFTRYNETLGMTVESYIDNAHNDYLNILVNTGIFSLLSYLAALISAFVRGMRKPGDVKIVIVLMSALLSYLIQIFFSFSICIISPLFWTAFALLDANISKEMKEVKK